MSVDPGARSRSKKTSSKRNPKDYARQRFQAIKRDGFHCVSEVLVDGWRPCGAKAHATAHVYIRNNCGPVSDHVDVVIRTCVLCHDKLDNRLPNKNPEVRFPLDARQRAWDRVFDACKETKLIGPRPE